MFALIGFERGNFATGRPDRFSPEEGVMLNADLPQPLGSSVVRKLKTDCTFELFILEGREHRETESNVRIQQQVCLLCLAEDHLRDHLLRGLKSEQTYTNKTYSLRLTRA